jgi:DNA (cytosine-5)-methyltransferase 1
VTSDNIIHLTRVLRWNRAVKALQASRGLSFISMFSGIEAASVAFGPLGWRATCFAEIEKFPAAVLRHHYPDVPNVGDMSKHDWSQYRGRVDIVCGGPPCQAFSVAGLRESLDDARGNLSLVYMKALHAIKPRNAIVENVPGWLSTKDNAFGCFLAGLVGHIEPLIAPGGRRWPNAGMVAGPQGRAAWRVLDGQFFGLAQRRKRVIVVADFGNGADPAAVLFEPEGVRRDSPPSRETGKGVAATVAPSLTASGRGVERTGDTRGQDPVVAVFAPPIARCVATREGSSQDYESTTMVAVHAIQSGALRENPNSGPDGVGVQADIAYTLEARAEVQAVSVTGQINHVLKAEGADASEDGTGRGTPIIAFSAKDYGADASTEIAPTLRAGGHTSSHANAGVMPAIVQTVALRGREGGATAELGGDVANALRASSGGGDKPHVLTRAVAIDCYNGSVDGDTTLTLRKGNGNAMGGVPAALYGSAVRRLTPRECERLQGFPDDYTAIPWRGKPAEECPDGPRYKALGNSWAVPLFAGLGERIQRFMPY